MKHTKYRNARLLFAVLRMQSRVRAWQASRAEENRNLVRKLYAHGKKKLKSVGEHQGPIHVKADGSGSGRSQDAVQALKKKIKASMKECALHALGYTKSSTTVCGVHYYGNDTTVPIIVDGKTGTMHMFEALKAGPVTELYSLREPYLCTRVDHYYLWSGISCRHAGQIQFQDTACGIHAWVQRF